MTNYKAGGWFLHRIHSPDVLPSSQEQPNGMLPLIGVGIVPARFFVPHCREGMLQKTPHCNLPLSLASEPGMLRLGASRASASSTNVIYIFRTPSIWASPNAMVLWFLVNRPKKVHYPYRTCFVSTFILQIGWRSSHRLLPARRINLDSLAARRRM